MKIAINYTANIPSNECIALIASEKTDWAKYDLTKEEIKYIQEEIKNKQKIIPVNQYTRWIFIYKVEKKSEQYQTNEAARKAGGMVSNYVNKKKISSVVVVDADNQVQETLCFAEGMALGNYQFLKYKQHPKKEENTLSTISISCKTVTQKQIDNLQIIVDATCKARDLINEPVLYLTATQLAKEFQQLGKEAGFNVEVLNKAQIQSLKMGGLLAVNMGSIDPPTFTIMEWKPKNAKNKKPIVLVGKGIVFDTGGINVKIGMGMETMKCDMSGGAAVGCAMYAIAKAKLPVHVIALVPATDNRVDGNSIIPGDVVTMHNGVTVEILNTDAEGRLILGDALSYAQKYKPQLVIDFATLTGAAAKAIGHYGTVCMGTADEKTKNELKESGNNVYERLVEFPFWEEYGELVKSDVAEIKNTGGAGAFASAGMITAGKFLEHFVNYPWMHLDIAGPAFLQHIDSYRGRNGTGIGVRLLFDFLQKQI